MFSACAHGKFTVKWRDHTKTHGSTLITCCIANEEGSSVSFFFNSLEAALEFKHSMLGKIEGD